MLRLQKIFSIHAYVDASIATHIDGDDWKGWSLLCIKKTKVHQQKSHGGGIGNSSISSCHCVELFSGATNGISRQRISNLVGDCVRTKHMRTRMHVAMEAITEKRIVVKYVHLLGMIANGFNKTLVGSDFDSFVDQVLGTNKSTSGR